MLKMFIAGALVLACTSTGFAQQAAATAAGTMPATVPATRVASTRPIVPVSPAVVPGNGLAQHDFFYAGESRDRKMYIVKGGQITWSYDDPAGRGEISDAMLLSNGNILFAHQYAVKLISPEKKVLWNYDAPAGTEIHTAVAIGHEHVLFIQNRAPAMLKVVNITTGETEKQFELPVKNPTMVHGHFRHARITPAGTLVVAHMDMGKVSEYDADGKELWSNPAVSPWGVTPLANGNFLIVDKLGVHEISHEHKTVWEVTKADFPGYVLSNLQLAWRLPNGNTLFNNWGGPRTRNPDPTFLPVQALEVTPDKKIVWALRSWTPPENLGTATTIQLMDSPESVENVSFGGIK